MGNKLSSFNNDVDYSIVQDCENKEFLKLQELQLISYDPLLDQEVTKYVEKCILKYIYKQSHIRNRMNLFKPEFTFLEDNEFDVLITKNTRDNHDYFLAEYFVKETEQFFMTINHTKWYKTETMPGVYDENISDSILTISDKGVIFSGEKYLNGQLFIKDIYNTDKSDDNTSISSKVVEHVIYKPDGVEYATYSSSELANKIEIFLDEYYDEIVEITQ